MVIEQWEKGIESNIYHSDQLKQWLEANKLDNGKVRNQKIIHFLNQSLIMGEPKDIETLLSYYDKDFFQENKQGPQLDCLAHYYNDYINLKTVNKNSDLENSKIEQQLQSQVRRIQNISPKYNSDWEQKSMTKNEQLFKLCSKQLMEKDKTHQKVFIKSFFEDFPETKPVNLDSLQFKSKFYIRKARLKNQSYRIVGLAVENNFCAESLKELEQYNFSLHEPEGYLTTKAMATPVNKLNPYIKNQQREKEVIEFLLAKNNEINASTLATAIKTNKSHKTIKKLLDNFSDHNNINQKLTYIAPNGNIQKSHIFDYLIERKDIDSIDQFKSFLKKGMTIPYRKDQIAIKAMKSNRECQFIDELLSYSEKTQSNSVPFYDMITETNFQYMIENFIETKYKNPNLVSILEQHDMMYHKAMEKPNSTQLNIKKLEKIADKHKNGLGQAIIENLQNKLEANKQPNILDQIKGVEKTQQKRKTYSF